MTSPHQSRAPARSAGVLSALIALAALVGLRAFDPAPIEALRHATFDFFERRYAEPLGSAAAAVVVATEGAEARGGWSAERLAILVERLSAAGVRAVALTAPIAADDAGLARLVTAIGRVPTAIAETEGEGQGTGRPEPVSVAPGGAPLPTTVWRLSGRSANPPALEAAAAAVGHALTAPPDERSARRIPALVRLGEAVRPALAVALLRAASGAEATVLEAADDRLAAVRIGSLRAPTDAEGGLWPRYPAPGSVPVVSGAALLAGESEAALAGRLAVIGATEATQASPVGPLGPALVHAVLADRLSRGAMLRRPVWADGAETASVALAGLAALAVMALGRGRWRLIAVALLVLAPAIVTTVAFTGLGLLLDPNLATIAVLVVVFAVLEVRAVHRLAGQKSAPRTRASAGRGVRVRRGK